MSTPTAYPLAWPVGRERTPRYRITRARFGTGVGVTRRALTVYAGIARLVPELERLGAKNIVVSTNVETRKSDGLPRSDRAEPADRGVAVYFSMKGEPHCLACDRWDRVADNLAAIAAHVEAIRGQLRWGVGDVRAAFAGFKALPAADAIKPWWQVLGFREAPTSADVLKAKFRELATLHHPDRGGNGNQMAEINAAYEAGLRAVSA